MNNGQIDNTSYYTLPCGRQLEDYIWNHRLSFHQGSALKYRYRAGKKDGESSEKDLCKRDHYCRFLAGRFKSSLDNEVALVEELYVDALGWDGEDIRVMNDKNGDTHGVVQTV